MAPELTFEEYSGDLYRGRLEEDAFGAALPRARARLVELTGTEVPEAHERAWKGALCAVVDRVGGADEPGVRSETVGSTSVTYDESRYSATDLDAVSPWLAGTGLLYRGLA